MAIAKGAAAMFLVTSLLVYATHTTDVHLWVGAAILAGLVVLAVPAKGRVAVAASMALSLLGLAEVWGVHGIRETHAGRILGDLGWAQAGLALWLTYTNAVELTRTRMTRALFDDAARQRWREGDLGFGAELAKRVVVRAQPSWAVLVVEAAWPDERPGAIASLIDASSGASRTELAQLKDGITGDDPRIDLARKACDVLLEAHGRPGDEVGGLAVARFIVAAAQAVRDDEDAARLFAAVVLPALASGALESSPAGE
jgi:hypothetical protein